jgi:hypothetical protein
MIIVAFDPGGTTGWAIFNTEANPPVTMMGECKGMNAFFKWLKDHPAFDQAIVEGYLINNKKFDHQFTRAETIQVIGAIKLWAWQNNIPLKEQPNTIKNPAYGWLGIPNKHKHNEDALVHGIYWMVKNKHLNVSDLVGK